MFSKTEVRYENRDLLTCINCYVAMETLYISGEMNMSLLFQRSNINFDVDFPKSSE